jgi:hypothetical protein
MYLCFAQMTTPGKNVIISGDLKTEAPYSLAMQSVYNGEPSTNAGLSFDPIKRSVDFKITGKQHILLTHQ